MEKESHVADMCNLKFKENKLLCQHALTFSKSAQPSFASSRWTSHVTSNWTVKDYTVTLILVSL